MVKYYYDRYIVKRIYLDTSPWVLTGNADVVFSNGYSQYTHNPDTNVYNVLSSYSRWGALDAVSVGSSLYYPYSGSLLTRRVARHTGVANSSIYVDVFTKTASQNTQGDAAGPLHTSNIIAEDGTYPANGKHTDSYWYIRRGVALVNPALSVNIDGAWSTYDDGWVNIDSVWRQIDTIHVNIDGTWCKSE